MGYLRSWEDMVAKRKGFSNKQKKMMLMPKETRQGIEVTGMYVSSYIAFCLCAIILVFIY